MMVKSRIKVKGHYRTVERDEKGRFVSCEKWHSGMLNTLEAKTKIAKKLREKFPDAEIGFFHEGEHYVLENGEMILNERQ